MALRATLDEIVEMSRLEGKQSSNAARGVDHLDYIRQLVRRTYNSLLDEHTWKHLALKRENCFKDMAAGQRYYDFPTTLNTDKITKVWVKWGNTWVPMTEGIGYDQYNAKDSENAERSDPVSHWNWYGYQQFEVWPIPASATGRVGFEGYKKGELLTNGTNRADLDDIMLSLYVGGELLIDDGQEELGKAKIALANRRRGTMIAAKSTGGSFRMGGSDPKMSQPSGGINIQFIRKSN